MELNGGLQGLASSCDCNRYIPMKSGIHLQIEGVESRLDKIDDSLRLFSGVIQGLVDECRTIQVRLDTMMNLLNRVAE